ncbi:MAG: formate dehydrogenase accessory protein FdhE [Dehalococcoidia bacterium]|nr:formate dehydrogenase accessory protein FdhE [Dehalococcoidia bacterium]
MTNGQHTEWQRETERCTRLYEGFAEAAPFVNAAYRCIHTFFEDHPITAQPAADPEEAAQRLRVGASLQMNPSLATADVVDLLRKLGAALAEANPDLKGTARALEGRSERLLLDSQDSVGKEDIQRLFASMVEVGELEQDLATFLLTLTLSSLYRRHLQLTGETLRTELWREGHCPLCGESPHYGLLRPEDGAKQLECWLCGTRWVYTRIKCPFCSNEEQDDLGYFTVEDREMCRVSFCRRCHRYLKIIDARKLDAGGDIMLAIHNLASLSHDLLAAQEGFAPGSGLQWVNPREMAGAREDY